MANIWNWFKAQKKQSQPVQHPRLSLLEPLEPRLLLSADLPGSQPLRPLEAPPQDQAVVADMNLETASDQYLYIPGIRIGPEVPIDSLVGVQTDVSGPLINLDDFRADPRFAGIDGSGLSVVVIDTGIDLNHPFFGPDANGNGIADRIVYQYDFSGSNDANASDTDGHGSNVASIVGSSDTRYRGMAPAVNLIALKVFPDGSGSATWADIEEALQWVARNVATYNIAAVNMSLGAGNYNTPTTSQLSDEIQAITNAGGIVVCSAGNEFYPYGSAQGVSAPAADPNALAVSAVWDGNNGGPWYWVNGAIDYSTAADRVISFSQRSATMTSTMAPGAMIYGAGADGGVINIGGTSQASPHIAGIVALMQKLALQRIGRRLTLAEIRSLLRTTGVTVRDGDNENDNVTNTNLDFRRVDVLALGNAIAGTGTQVSIAALDASAGEPSNNGTYRITRTGSTSAALTVNFTVAGTATRGSDYQLRKGTTVLTGNSVVISAGQSYVDVTLAVIDDTIAEPTETAIVTLAAGTGYTVGSANRATVNIAENEVQVSIAATDASAGEPTNNGTYRISRTGPTSAALTVNFTVAGTATRGSDYQLRKGTTVLTGNAVVINAGQSYVDVTLAVLDDTRVELTETAIVTLAAGTGYTVAPAPANRATVNIADNEPQSPLADLVAV